MLDRSDQRSATNETLHVIIPCKGLDSGKSRLSNRLDCKNRRSLCETLLKRTLESSIAIVPHVYVSVVTSDEHAASIGGEYGADAIPDGGGGLNAALEHARCVLRKRVNGPCTLMVLPIDLPLARSDTLQEFLKCPGDVLIAPDENAQGTNVLVLRSAAAWELEFRYGDQSFSSHQAAARACGRQATVFRHPSLAFDIDEPSHYDRWLSYGEAVS